MANAWHGMAWHDKLHGDAWQMAWRCMASVSVFFFDAWHGMAIIQSFFVGRMAWHGKLLYMAWHGMAYLIILKEWHGMAWHGPACHGMAWLNLRMAWHGMAKLHGCAWRRMAFCHASAWRIPGEHATMVSVKMPRREYF